jgi:hypothetical protein
MKISAISFLYKRLKLKIACFLAVFSPLLILSCNNLFSSNFSSRYPDSYLKGMNIFFMTSRNHFEELDFAESLGRLKSDGVNALFLIPYWFSRDEKADSIFPTSETIPDSLLGRAITMARDSGFTVILKPHIDLFNGKPRCTIEPNDYAAWFTQYTAFITHYLDLAARFNLDRFVIGTELDHVASHREFLDLCDRVRSVYHMSLIYAASYDHYLAAKIWDHVDHIGVNAYFNLDNSDNYSIAQLRDSWNYWLNTLDDFAAQHHKPLIITEAGYFSRVGAAKNPGSWERNSSPDMAVQRDCYEALLSQANRFDRVTGIFWWQWELGKIGGLDNSDATPRDKPAEEVLKKYWGAE